MKKRISKRRARRLYEVNKVLIEDFRKLRKKERRLYRENINLNSLLEDAISTLASIASITVFDETERTVRFCLDMARELAADALEELHYAPGYVTSKGIEEPEEAEEITLSKG